MTQFLNSKAELYTITHPNPTVVFEGYSGLDYSDKGAVIARERQRILQDYKYYQAGPNRPLMVTAGATEIGIGGVYHVAKALAKEGLNIITVGIVSEHGKKSVSEDVDIALTVHDPDKSWKVLDENGHSIMVDVIGKTPRGRFNGHMEVLGGGGVALSEIAEAHGKGLGGGIPLRIEHFRPNPAKLAKKMGIPVESMTLDALRAAEPLRMEANVTKGLPDAIESRLPPGHIYDPAHNAPDRALLKDYLRAKHRPVMGAAP